MEPLLMLILFVIVVLLAAIVFYNKIILASQKVNEAWSDVDVQLNRRHDLIPNLVNTVKGYAKHEQELLEKVTKARTNALEHDKKDLSGLGSIEKEIGEDINSILMVAEAYPDLKANENFLKLQENLTETEDQIASSRRIYNANVASYNTLLQIFPLNFIAKIGGFKESSFFEFKDNKDVPSASIK
jgi:LemA protein